jgi:hypothetical protein
MTIDSLVITGATARAGKWPAGGNCGWGVGWGVVSVLIASVMLYRRAAGVATRVTRPVTCTAAAALPDVLIVRPAPE